jgi:hypothetical protein
MSLITICLGIIIHNQRKSDSKLDEVKNATIQNTVILQELPIAEMKADIRSNRHKIAQLDKAMTQGFGKMGERIGKIEERYSSRSRD